MLSVIVVPYVCRGAELEKFIGEFWSRILRGQNPEGSQTRRSAGGAADDVINLKTAKQIGLTIPPEVLARASRLIK
jgi:ABC-type uncharacterized transport system substrate-binding protein